MNAGKGQVQWYFVLFIFYVIGNFVPITQKMLREDRTAAELNNVANATRRRRRILQAGFFLRGIKIGDQDA